MDKAFYIFLFFFSNRTIPFPKDNRLKVYFDGASAGEPRLLMQAIQVSAPLLATIGLELEYRGHKVFRIYIFFY